MIRESEDPFLSNETPYPETSRDFYYKFFIEMVKNILIKSTCWKANNCRYEIQIFQVTNSTTFFIF